MKPVYVIMGVSGSGKTTVGKLLADKLRLPFFDADNFHPKSNVKKMSSGIPLTDEDRQPWLKTLSEKVTKWMREKGAVLACSALKESYRQILSSGNDIRWVVLNGSYDTILNRMQDRQGHYMGADMLKSQFEALELPDYGLLLDVDKSPILLVSEILKDAISTKKSTLGIIGLGVMGRNLAHNVLSHGISVSVYNRPDGDEVDMVTDFLAEADTPLAHGFITYPEFIQSLKIPRKILLMIPAGPIVDSVLLKIQPHLSTGDILMDGGNSHFEDTMRRFEYYKKLGIEYMGIGISGGSEGALKGPSMMAGGSTEAYRKIQPVLETITAKDIKQKPCAAHLGPNGAGHFVKMVHNGIEYAEMQLLAEVYSLLRLDKDNVSVSKILAEWSETELSSYLLGIAADILVYKDGDEFLIDKISDKASNKGTGGWSTKAAVDLGIPATMMSNALFARYLSSFKELREKVSQDSLKIDRSIEIKTLKEAYQFARLINHYQGFDLIMKASYEFGWKIDPAEIARIWTNGCIIKSELIYRLHDRFSKNTDLWADKELISDLNRMEGSAHSIINFGMDQRISLPCLSAALQFWYGITTGKSTANLIQAQRDYFGAHTYERTDTNGPHTTNWTSNG
ncbi:MAG: NADP-dependent phosphogluconate dehydrogenase [Bacteroidia bacterium]|nr:NADP-dependent phosphogluconate dehydrogenase [Bacteroidia bacterium]MBT8275945.1 NADP-dependent phosphogluconate dehydrogenase [Bacteroidia bacterium]NNF31388.1 NADP-dependent phosphogluconate dehydrogenase [Flavobacteriaceae bacterium]NNK53020.1 NADP-dependent phosphogluconate dehydrogenase [Flavobacteriaceae bacterium]NNM09886.1 NADP-dependent phosphogluconate dehydrogenase [Flavobacteriaceae bacterium]